MKDNPNDRQLIQAYQQNASMELLGTLYSPYMPLVYGVCLKYLKNRELAQDAVMDIFEKLAVELKRHDTPENFKTWLFVVTKNFCLMKLRKDGTESRAFEKITNEIMEQGVSLHPFDGNDVFDLEPKLKDCLQKLKEYQRISIELFYFEKKCYREIAEELLVDEKKVKSDIQNGKRNLKLCLEDKTNE